MMLMQEASATDIRLWHCCCCLDEGACGVPADAAVAATLLASLLGHQLACCALRTSYICIYQRRTCQRILQYQQQHEFSIVSNCQR
jgi:hypothetical protein